MSKILFIGAGNMGQAIIHGIIAKNIFSPKDVFIYEVNDSTKKQVLNKFNIGEYKNIDSGISDFDILILAVKPQIFNNFENDSSLTKLKSLTNQKQIIISIMAGVNLTKLKKFFGNDKNIVRIMPNTPALIGEAMSVISLSEDFPLEKLEIVKNIFDSIGKTEVMEEKYLDAVTGLSGSGPAYVYMFLESLIQGGILCGLPKSIAEKLAIQTVLGSIKMVDGSKSIEELRHMVTSPAGTTIEAVFTLENNGFRGSIMEAVRSATERSKELGK